MLIRSFTLLISHLLFLVLSFSRWTFLISNVSPVPHSLFSHYVFLIAHITIYRVNVVVVVRKGSDVEKKCKRDVRDEKREREEMQEMRNVRNGRNEKRGIRNVRNGRNEE